jgi:sorting nexin-1/2
MQLDTEDGDTFVPPAGVVASPEDERAPSPSDRTDAQESETSDARTAAAEAE